MKEYGLAITGVGSYLPERVIPNSYFIEQLKLDTTDEWIIQHTGISRRHWARDDQATSDLATIAACNALGRINFPVESLQTLFIPTATPDHQFPNTACLVQANLQAVNARPLDIEAACTGAIAGLWLSKGLIESGMQENSLVVGAEKLSSVTNLSDRNTAMLFGDGAGAFLVEKIKDPGVFEVVYGGDGTKANLIMLPAGGSRKPASLLTVQELEHYATMEGHEVFKWAVRRMEEMSREVLRKAELTIGDIDFVIPHQANERIMRKVWDDMDVPEDKRISTVAETGNTSAASIPIAVDQAYSEGRIKPGHKLLLTAFGAGLTYGAAIVQWHLD